MDNIYDVSKYIKDSTDVTQDEKIYFKKIIYFVIFVEQKFLCLNFINVFSISESDFYEIFEDLLGEKKLLKRIKIFHANDSILKSLKKIVNGQIREKE